MAQTPIAAAAAPTASAGAAANPGQPSPQGPCRLPVVFDPDSSRSVKGGFVSYPGGHFTADAAAGFSYDSDTNTYLTQQSPQLRGNAPGFYDRSLNRWLPVTASSVAPDGLHYAYVAIPEPRLHIVEVRTGADRSIDLPSGYLTVLGHTANTVYLAARWEVAVPGLLAVDTVSGTATQVQSLNSRVVLHVGQSSLWLGEADPADPSPVIGAFDGRPQSNRLIRAGHEGNHAQSWYYEPGSAISVTGEDLDGHPVLVVARPGAKPRIILLTEPDRPVVITDGGLEDGSYYASVQRDQGGIWLGGSVIRRWSPAGGLTVAAQVAGHPAGRCL